MFNGIIYNQGLIKGLKKNPRYISGSLVLEITSNITIYVFHERYFLSDQLFLEGSQTCLKVFQPGSIELFRQQVSLLV